jgi:hypothetical protein
LECLIRQVLEPRLTLAGTSNAFRFDEVAGGTHQRQGAGMPKTVADAFVETLAAAGVKRIYGIVGGSLNGLTDAVRRQDNIEWVHVRHEETHPQSLFRERSHYCARSRRRGHRPREDHLWR